MTSGGRVNYFSADAAEEAKAALLEVDLDVNLGGARFPLITRIFGLTSSASVDSICAMETLADAGTVVVPVGPAVELKQDLEVLDMLTPVDMSLAASFLSLPSMMQIMSGLFWCFLGSN